MSPPIRDGSGNSIGSIRLGDGTEISEVRTGAGDVLFSAVSESTLLAYGSDDNDVYVHDVGGGFPLNSTLSQAGDNVRGGVSFVVCHSVLIILLLHTGVTIMTCMCMMSGGHFR